MNYYRSFQEHELPDDDLALLTQYMDVASYLVPSLTDKAATSNVPWHPDLHLDNVFVDFLFQDEESELPHGPLASDDALWADMEHGLKETIPEAARMRLRKFMPTAAPYTFTHSNLTNVNIMVENGHLTGIIDWEMSGYFPVWWEYVCTSVPDSEEDREWKTLLRKFMPDHSPAREFWLNYY